MARLRFLGAAEEVTGSCYELEAAGASLLIDCGLFQGDRDADERNRAELPIDWASCAGLVLTHGHLDHVGRTPRLANTGFTGSILGHAATLEVASILLEDSAKIAAHSEGPTLYGRDEVEWARSRLLPIQSYQQKVACGPFTIELFDAGHILGSSSVRVSYREAGADRAILFSGDLGRNGTPILRDPHRNWDHSAHAVDAIVTESTYGDNDHPQREEVRAQLKQVIARALKDGGKVLIPAFSIGRTQELLYELNSLVEAGELDRIPVIVDGPLALQATRIYERHTECYDEEAVRRLRSGDAPLDFDDLHAAHKPRDSQRAVDMPGPAIIIAGSGMCQGGRIRHHLERHLPNATTDVLLVGYQAGRTLGRALQGGADRVFIRGQEIAVRARVSTIHGLSAHAGRSELLQWFGAIPRRGKTQVFVTHGEREQAHSYATLLESKHDVRCQVPRFDDAVSLE